MNGCLPWDQSGLYHALLRLPLLSGFVPPRKVLFRAASMEPAGEEVSVRKRVGKKTERKEELRAKAD
jgi:hypothetical protein